jgi:iron complex outermembrane receptor protein
MKNCALILFLAFAHWCTGQECYITISGRVMDRATHEPLEFTTVELQEYKTGVLSDSLGQFVFRNVCPGSVHIHFRHIGCPVEGIFVNITRDTGILFYLEHHGELLHEIKVEGQLESSNNVQQAISTAVLQERPHASLAEIASEVAGVTMIKNGSGISKPIIHGMYGNRVAVINNGILQAGQQWGADHAPEVDPLIASNITVVKGSDAIEYGSQALGGAIRLDPGPIRQDPHFHGDIMYGYESNGRAHLIAFKGNRSFSKIDVRLCASMKRSGDHAAPNYFLTNTGLKAWSGALQLNYRASDATKHHFYYSIFNAAPGIFAGAHISNLTDLEQALASETPFNISDQFSYTIVPPRQAVTHQLLKYAGRRFVNATTSLEWSYAAQYNHRKEYDIRRGDRSAIPALDLRLWNHVIEVKRNIEGPRVINATGLQFRFADNFNSYETGILPLIPDYKEGYAGVFTSFEFPGENLTWNAGGRYDLRLLRSWAITMNFPHQLVQRDHIDHESALAVGLKMTPGEKATTRLHIVGARRSPAPNELYSFGLHQGIAGIEEGDWNLQSETSLKLILDQSLEIEHLAHVQVSVYSHTIFDYMYLRPEPELRLTIRGAFPVYRYVQEDAWIRGLDVLIVSDFSHRLEWSGKASFIRGTRLQDDTDLAQMPPTQFNSSLAWTFKDSRRWKSVKINIDVSHLAEQMFWDEEAELLKPPASYTLLNAGFSTGFAAGNNMIYGSVSIENLLDLSYRNYLNRLRYFADEEGRNVRVVLRYEF